MYKGPRNNTNSLLELIDEGILTHEIVLKSALQWMSDHDVGEMAICEGFFLEDEDEEEYECSNCGSAIIKEDVSLGYCIMCKYSSNNQNNENKTED